ncbi:DUF3243 domain-containing protein [Paenibacillus sp. PK4536]|uniref:DUF3243 domain-containing protein n=1 Tax=Paenibacillus nuruki TaxID=1886670 RepID=A0A1E3L1V8_9BACL|nr:MULTISPECIES: DUF3243 domain-containing protein [Paenibacillus]ODP27782.1 uncharacterized protein PTI45_02805 [Paenibacillus nuruki]TKJ89437.1 DUF3243 domain-containing protein [Paenibacillus sp. CFBP13512]WIM38089.1 DUF3243 domain-containing protein [Paenibacillus sp. PK4536]CAJ1315244.1 DUF3243 domain-containing protein [Paenibacillus nuruki]
MSEESHIVKKDGEIATGQVETTLNRLSDDQKDDILSNFESFKSYLGKRIQLGESIGLGEEKLAKIAQKVADYLAAHEEPRNREEKLLYELWKVGDEDQRHKLAHLLVRMVQADK